MTTTHTYEATKNIFSAMFADKYAQAIANGATDEQAIKAIRDLWIEALTPPKLNVYVCPVGS